MMVERPAYKKEPVDYTNVQLPSHLTGGGNGTAAEGEPHPARLPPSIIHSIEEAPQVGDINATIIKAGNVLFRATMAQIKYHQGELQKLHAMLRQFAPATSVPAENMPSSLSEDDVTFLRRAVEAMKEGQT